MYLANITYLNVLYLASKDSSQCLFVGFRGFTFCFLIFFPLCSRFLCHSRTTSRQCLCPASQDRGQWLLLACSPATACSPLTSTPPWGTTWDLTPTYFSHSGVTLIITRRRRACSGRTTNSQIKNMLCFFNECPPLQRNTEPCKSFRGL